MILTKNLRLNYKKGYIFVFLYDKLFFIQKCFNFIKIKKGFHFKYFWFFFVFKILFFFGLLNLKDHYFVKFLKNLKK